MHGSAPDIEGKNIANPIATILSLSMALRYSLDLEKEADVLDKAVQKVLDNGLRTKDIMSKNMKEFQPRNGGRNYNKFKIIILYLKSQFYWMIIPYNL